MRLFSCGSRCCRGYSQNPNGACCTYSYHISDAWLTYYTFSILLTIQCNLMSFDQPNVLKLAIKHLLDKIFTDRITVLLNAY